MAIAAHQQAIEDAMFQGTIARILVQRQPQIATRPTYQGRDPVTGLRIVQDADGGKSFGNYPSNSMPADLVGVPGRLTPGTLLSKPA
jgi:hypothetical protein